jgi:hypothetical protein
VARGHAIMRVDLVSLWQPRLKSSHVIGGSRLYSTFALARRRLDWGALTFDASHRPGNAVCSVEGIAAYGDLHSN